MKLMLSTQSSLRGSRAAAAVMLPGSGKGIHSLKVKFGVLASGLTPVNVKFPPTRVIAMKPK